MSAAEESYHKEILAIAHAIVATNGKVSTFQIRQLMAPKVETPVIYRALCTDTSLKVDWTGPGQYAVFLPAEAKVAQ